MLVFSAMRHFAQALKERGYRVHYVTLEDEQNTGSLAGELQRWQTLCSHRRFISPSAVTGVWSCHSSTLAW